MNVIHHIVRFAAACLVLTLAACGGGGGNDGGGGGAPPVAAVIGAAGGTVSGPNGAKVVIPPGALATDTTIAVEQTSAGAPAFPAGFSAFGQMFAFTPHGITFAVPVTVTLPFDAAAVPAGVAPALYKTNAQNQWEEVVGATFGANSVSAQITSFSFTQGLTPALPVRVWEFAVFPGNGTAEVRLDGDTQIGGLLEEVADFGPAFLDAAITGTTETRLPDQIANGVIASTADGVTYSVMAEAPDGRLGTAQPIGSVSRLTQTQSFVKDAVDATLKFTLTAVLIDLIDTNPPLLTGPSPMKGELIFSVGAYKNSASSFFYGSARASVFGARDFFFRLAADEDFSRNHIWSEDDFDFVVDSEHGVIVSSSNISCLGTRAVLRLKKPLTYSVDLSSVLKGEEFTLRADAIAETNNRRGGGFDGECQTSSVHAFLRDPLEIGGATLTTTGLTPTNRPLPAPPTRVLVEPASCVPGPGPNAEAGVLQFDAASYAIDEFAGAVQTVSVTRTGGSAGAVSATFTTSDGTASGGIDYTPLNVTVFFADGEAGKKIVSVPIIQDQLDEIDKTVNLTLSQPGGCAALGAQTTAVLTIRDDDAPALAPSGLDPTFGIGGKASTTAFGGDRSAMALQADGKIVMVGGTFVDFVLARFNADGSIDRNFGIDGKVTTDMGGGLRAEEALGVAIQPDGKIVVVGYTAIPTTPPAPRLPDTFALARYNSDGSLDTSFGTGGRVSGNVNGIARAVALQPDGKIVLAGEFELALSNGTFVSDFTVARFNTNGSLDLAFGTSGTGQVATDIGNAANSARNLVIQPNGAIVVSGKPQCSQSGCDHTDVVRYNANGTLDTSFGSGGKLTLAGVEVGEGLVRQSDGKLVLAGGVTTATVPTTARFVLMRLNADGAIDTSFGTAGTVDTAFTESATANAVGLQADGKIVAVGTRAFSANPNFIVARYNTNGSVDATFGSDGNLSIDFFGFSDAGENVLVQPDGKIVVGGLARNNVDGYGVARINP
jgi:uncharacterized delta-60 repeat protein